MDALRFTALAERADRGAPDEAIALLEEALRLWRGEALADLPDTPLRAATADQLKQAATAALLGQHRDPPGQPFPLRHRPPGRGRVHVHHE
ncbi:BTAD domain-containing putative transcriptional regulator [Kitasatospora sp. NPDC001683]